VTVGWVCGYGLKKYGGQVRGDMELEHRFQLISFLIRQ
jgi:hypothetical protein